MNHRKNERTNCMEILNSKKFWTLSWEDIEQDLGYNSKILEESFHLYFIGKKLKIF
jgi:hypothetical protein